MSAGGNLLNHASSIHIGIKSRQLSKYNRSINQGLYGTFTLGQKNQLNNNTLGNSMPLKRIYLEHTTDGHYKFYEMIDNGDNTFIAKYGKINTAGSSEVYSTNLWAKKLSEKLNKGYRVIEEQDFKKSDATASQADIQTMLAKLNVLSRTIEEVINIEPNQTLSTQLKTVNKIADRIKNNKLILSTDLTYCNRLFKKAIGLRKKLIP